MTAVATRVEPKVEARPRAVTVSTYLLVLRATISVTAGGLLLGYLDVGLTHPTAAGALAVAAIVVGVLEAVWAIRLLRGATTVRTSCSFLVSASIVVGLWAMVQHHMLSATVAFGIVLSLVVLWLLHGPEANRYFDR